MIETDLSTLALFKNTRPEILAKLKTVMGEKVVRGGVALFHQDDEGTEAFIVVRGAVRIERIAEDGKRILLNILGPGEIFGEMALITGNPRTAHAVAHTDSTLLVIRRPGFNDLMAANVEFSGQLMKVLSRRLAHASHRLEEVGLIPLKCRLAGLLLDLRSRFGVKRGAYTEIGIKLTQSDIAELAVSSREHVNKALKVWERDNIISVSSGIITIHSPDILEEIHENAEQ